MNKTELKKENKFLLGFKTPWKAFSISISRYWSTLMVLSFSFLVPGILMVLANQFTFLYYNNNKELGSLSLHFIWQILGNSLTFLSILTFSLLSLRIYILKEEYRKIRWDSAVRIFLEKETQLFLLGSFIVSLISSIVIYLVYLSNQTILTNTFSLIVWLIYFVWLWISCLFFLRVDLEKTNGFSFKTLFGLILGLASFVFLYWILLQAYQSAFEFERLQDAMRNMEISLATIAFGVFTISFFLIAVVSGSLWVVFVFALYFRTIYPLPEIPKEGTSTLGGRFLSRQMRRQAERREKKLDAKKQRKMF